MDHEGRPNRLRSINLRLRTSVVQFRCSFANNTKDRKGFGDARSSVSGLCKERIFVSLAFPPPSIPAIVSVCRSLAALRLPPVQDESRYGRTFYIQRLRVRRDQRIRDFTERRYPHPGRAQSQNSRQQIDELGAAIAYQHELRIDPEPSCKLSFESARVRRRVERNVRHRPMVRFDSLRWSSERIDAGTEVDQLDPIVNVQAAVRPIYD